MGLSLRHMPSPPLTRPSAQLTAVQLTAALLTAAQLTAAQLNAAQLTAAQLTAVMVLTSFFRAPEDRPLKSTTTCELLYLFFYPNTS